MVSVLFKRKPVQYVSRPDIDNEDTERRFICQITGHSGLSFFEALKSELAGAAEVEEAFPQALKGPILRRVQFQTISRIDTLVDLIFEEFRSDYYPGESVTVHVVTGERLNGTVRDKTRFGSKVLPDGTLSPPFSRYFVSLDNRPTEEAVVDDAHINRDRKIFTKQVLRSFIKKTVTREAWTGAPWLVKHDVAAEFHIDTRVPPHLKYENKAAERKQIQSQKKVGNANDFDAMVGSFHGGVGTGSATQQRLPELKPAPKSHKSKQQQSQLAKTNGPPQQVGPHFQNFHNSTFAFAPLASLPPAPPPPPPIKYPIDDLEVPPRIDGPKRPSIKYYSQDLPMLSGEATAAGNGISMTSIGPLLETWDTLNVYCQVFKLDSFTFDDFVEALQFTSEDVECELFVEVHCAVLKVIVDPEVDDGKVQVRLPDMDDDEDEDEEEDSTMEASALPTPTPEPEPKPKGRATRSSLAKAEAEALKAAPPEPVPEAPTGPKSVHRAAEIEAAIDWIERLQKRDFKNGGWESIIVGLLHQLSKDPRHLPACEALLVQLAPLDLEPTQETVRAQYAKLDVNFRIQALQIICLLTAETKAIRGYMEESSEHMTALRKEKITFQRVRKEATEALKKLNEERKLLEPPPPAPTPAVEAPETSGDVTMHDAEEEVQDSHNDEVMDTDEEIHHGRSLRRGNDRAAERKRKREAEQEKKEKAEAEAKIPKPSKQLTKLLKDIQKKQDEIRKAEEEIAILDNDLREADCPRTRVLGKDRFWNRYYWFERNGMPYAGLPTSSTADAGYANGCIWIQGPDDLEREGYIEMRPEWQNEYRCKFNMSVPERKIMEEGSTHVFNARQWGYYDDPETVEGLIDWLDTRGNNELKLRKELIMYKDKITDHMAKRKEYLNPSEEKSVESSANKRMSTRGKAQMPHPDHTAHRCLAWRNNTAIKELGHLHSDQPRNRKPAKKVVQAQAQPVVVEEERQTRSEARNKRGGKR
ncbi:putative ITC1-subunit of Isw2 chromatin remodelling complex protein [Rutstroemia sp. NJR-2017a WRK4]|nr:putative ITC1-subunit of Isw2 chromatin remodelling complex protein [Rutstroemia sp. NJR-2017a WRK4]